MKHNISYINSFYPIQFKSANIQTDEVTKLEITGRVSEESDIETINFVANRVRLQIEVERKRFNQSFATSEKYKLIEEEYLRIRKDLIKVYKSQIEK